MTNNQLTTELLQELYSTAVSCEVAERAGAYMASFDLLCKADDSGGIAHLVRKLIDDLRADRAELQERRKAMTRATELLSGVVLTDKENLIETIGRIRVVISGDYSDE
ncbi:hypothetical protein KGG54_11625 [Klebsiella variicola subsp. variicola]|uniref:hypothetical protein n=1 Tax=Klebsiella variicola TaxID=244366 RepID=UPI001D85EFC8|nr:hypothetical protein [Klebsiella variicola]MCB8420929.1 hypothetical protein [Klebsiella variicola subsp. variicola]MCB8442551.1 hypothetical protein [Klebsiella variicola subsp. variicola]MCB8496345.1 hypothetical protein [Klebsiella variicola subsp. variicola]